jgi:hypothetical protein
MYRGYARIRRWLAMILPESQSTTRTAKTILSAEIGYAISHRPSHRGQMVPAFYLYQAAALAAFHDMAINYVSVAWQHVR